MDAGDQARRAAVRQAWRETLERDPASDGENFFAAGGNSILVVALQRRLTTALGYRLPLRRIHDQPTVDGILGLAARHSVEQVPTSAPASGLDLYCLPYAGASARVYDGWSDRLPAGVTVRPLEFPGRGSRWSEPPVARLPDLLVDLSAAMDTARPYVVFGHSFGGIVAFELVRHLRAAGLPSPRRLLVSGCPAPHLATPAETTHDLSDAEFTRRLRRLRGTPEELLANDELMELYIPVIRADYTILDHYRAPAPTSLGCPISAFYGRDDAEVTVGAIGEWSRYGDRPVTVEEVNGDHFFLHGAEAELVAKVAAHLDSDLNR